MSEIVKTKKTKHPGNRRTQSLPFLRRESPGEWKGGERNPAGSGACVLIVGGNANNEGNDGPGYVNVNNGLGNSNTNYGARQTKGVSKLTEDFGMDSVFPHRRNRWIGLSHIHFSTLLERVGCTSAPYEVAA